MVVNLKTKFFLFTRTYIQTLFFNLAIAYMQTELFFVFLRQGVGVASKAPLYNFRTAHDMATTMTQNNVLIETLTYYDVIIKSYCWIYRQNKKKCRGKLECLIFEMLIIRNKRPTLNTQSDSIRAKLFI